MKWITGCAIFLIVLLHGTTGRIPHEGHGEGHQGHHHEGHTETEGRHANPYTMCKQILSTAGFNPKEGCMETTRKRLTEGDMQRVYNGNHREVFREWVVESAFVTLEQIEANVENICARQICFMVDFHRKVKRSGKPQFCVVEGKTAFMWFREMGVAKRQLEVEGVPLNEDMIESYLCAHSHMDRHIRRNGPGLRRDQD